MDRFNYLFHMIVNVTIAILFFIQLNVRHRTIEESLLTAVCKHICLYFVCIQSAIIVYSIN